jgi:hypothetical protein
MRKLATLSLILALCGGAFYAVSAAEKAAEPAKEAAAGERRRSSAFESRKGASELTQKRRQARLAQRQVLADHRRRALVRRPLSTARCRWARCRGWTSRRPGGGQAALGEAGADADVRRLLPQRRRSQAFTPPKLPKDKKPAPVPTMEAMVPDLANFQHGRGRIWCMDCHHTTQRNKLVDHFGDPVSFDQPQLLCGKCHGDKLRDWRDGIHGKRIGEFVSTGKKRWFTCTECHNPHNVQDGARNKGFIQVQPEPSPQLPRGMANADHEKLHPIPH